MAQRPVNPANGRYTIRGRNNRNLDLTLDDPDLNKYIVDELDGDDMQAKLPADNPLGINWFACFSVYNKRNGNKSGYATVKYSFTTNLQKGQRLFVAYHRQAYEVTEEFEKNRSVTLSEGDPATGSVP